MFLGCEGILENSFFRETVGARVWGGAVLTIVEQGYDPSVA